MSDKWDRRFLDLCILVSSWSKDPSTKVGSCIVDVSRRVISLGYNGFARSVRDDPARYDNREVKYQMVVHAERNALLFARQPLEGCTIYTTPIPPCAACAAMIIQSGITRVVSYRKDVRNPRWIDSFVLAEEMYREADIEYSLI